MAPNAAGRPATDLCPTELWEQILAELCDDSDDLLLGPISQSCRDLRGLAVWMALQRHGLTPEVLSERVLRLPTGIALRALAMHLASRRPTPLEAAELDVQCGYQWAQHVTPPDLAPFLDDIASNVSLPHLTELHLHLEEDFISPGALRTLLANNPTLHGIFYHGASRPVPERTLLLDAPLVHPSLAAIHTSSSLLNSAEPTARLVPALIDSPKLIGFSFTFRAYHNADDDASGLLTDLKAIAGCGREGMILFLNHLESGLSTFWSESREAIDTARLFSAPRCVLTKIYTTTNEVSTAHRLLPWLAAMRPQAPVNAHFKLVLSDRVQAGFGSAQTSESKRRAIERGLLDEAGRVLQGDNWTVTVAVVFSGFGADTISFA
uniref:F-box domain-containing protein n=1 Tax=Mycena chlorophos TaxID=658473 RepID=A0ABQ0LUJ9_MYCCL|nr:predicted protein [Mycena chlorophos]